jgi:hypothetical protein
MSNLIKSIKNSNKALYFIHSFISKYFSRESFFWQLSNYFFQKYYILREYKNIKKLKKFSKVILVYDCRVSPPTYGDFFSYIMIARYFKKKNFNVEIIIIKNEYRGGWKRFVNKKKINSFLKELSKLSSYLMMDKRCTPTFLNWNIFTKIYSVNSIKPNEYIFCSANVFNRLPLYLLADNFLNYFIKKEKNSFIKNFLLKKDPISLFKKKNYVSLLCRHSSKSHSQNRNLSISNLISIIDLLSKKFSKYKILIVSDEYGCKYFKKVLSNYPYKCYFSKDYTSNFVSDGKLVLNSKASFQFAGGGISHFLFFSRTPFIVYNKAYSFIFNLFFIKGYFWLKKNQIKYFNKNIESFLFKIKNSHF